MTPKKKNMRGTFSYWYNRILEFGILLLIVVTPLMFGTIEVWMYSLMEGSIFLLFLGGEAKIVRGKKYLPSVETFSFLDSRIKSFSIFLFLFMGIMLFQIIPLSPAILKKLSQNTHELYKITLRGYDTKEPAYISTKLLGIDDVSPVSQAITQPKDSRSISVRPYATKRALIRYASYVLVFFFLLRHFRFQEKSILWGYSESLPSLRRKCRKPNVQNHFISAHRIIQVIIATGFLLSLLGILQKMTSPEKIFWLFPADERRLFSSFPNRNNFAGYINMIIPFSIAMLIARQYDEAQFHNQGIRHLLRNILLGLEPWLKRNGFYALAAITMISAVLFSASRGGALSFLFGMVVFFSLHTYGKKNWVKTGQSTLAFGSSLLLLSMVIFVAFLWTNTQQLEKRFSEFQNIEQYLMNSGRPNAMRSTWKMAHDFSIFGVGVGGFQNLYFKYRPKEIADSVYRYSHSDVLQIFAETGLIGVVVVSLFVFFYLKCVLKNYRQIVSPTIKVFIAGGIASISTMIFHSIFGFNIQIPANAFLFSCILALTFLISYSSRKEETASADQKPVFLQKNNLTSIILSGIIFIGGGYLIKYVFQQGMADYHSSIPNQATTKKRLHYLRKAILLDPENSLHYYEMGKRLLREHKKNATNKQTLIPAIECFRRSIQLNPIDPYAQVCFSYAIFQEIGFIEEFQDGVEILDKLDPYNSYSQTVKNNLSYLFH